MSEYERIATAAEWVRAQMGEEPRLAVVLGSGLADVASALGPERRNPADVPGWPRSTVAGHPGLLTFASGGLVTLAGRVHLYEGFAPHDVVFPLRALILAGARTIILTNAAGGLDPAMQPGDLVLLRDQLNLTGATPLVGPNDPRLGVRFPDLTHAYDIALRAEAQRAAAGAGLGPLREGIYAGLAGPAYETPAEVRMLRTLGADLVGMSTVLETIAAVHMGARVLGISCVANLAAGLTPQKLTHEEVLAISRQTEPRLEALLRKVIDGLLSPSG